MISIYQWINIWKRIDRFIILHITFEIFKNTHVYINKSSRLSRINKWCKKKENRLFIWKNERRKLRKKNIDSYSSIKKGG
jgi:hypothetical protein